MPTKSKPSKGWRDFAVVDYSSLGISNAQERALLCRLGLSKTHANNNNSVIEAIKAVVSEAIASDRHQRAAPQEANIRASFAGLLKWSKAGISIFYDLDAKTRKLIKFEQSDVDSLVEKLGNIQGAADFFIRELSGKSNASGPKESGARDRLIRDLDRIFKTHSLQKDDSSFQQKCAFIRSVFQSFRYPQFTCPTNDRIRKILSGR